jgi:hypothetical protein
MSQATVRREIADLRRQADAMDARSNDPTHVFASERHRAHLQHEAARLRAAALSEERNLEQRLAARSHPSL